MVRLAFATVSSGAPVMGRDLVVSPLQRHTPVRAVLLSRVRSEDRSQQEGLLSWGSSILPFRRHRRCVHSQTNRRSPFGPRPPRLELVPSLSFLPTSTVSSAARPRSEDQGLFGGSQVCCTLQPAVGSTTFRVSCGPKTAPRSTLMVRGLRETVPYGEDPSKLSPPR
jgi:hypothetical protein